MKLSTFSDGYYLANDMRVGTHAGEKAIIYTGTYERLASVVGEPVVASINSRTWYLETRNAVPADYIALPDSQQGVDEDEPVLIQKPDPDLGNLV